MKNLNAILIVIGIIVVAYVILQINPELNFSFLAPGGSNQSSTYYYNQTMQPQSDSRAPTSMYANVEPNPVTMKSRVLGTVSSDGYKYPITVHAKHRGQGTEQTFGALLDSTGRFLLTQTVDLPGYWQFWTTAGAVRSNTFELTVSGVATASDKDHISKTLSPTCNIAVFSHHRGSVQIFANDPAHAVSIPLAVTTVNSGGYGVASVDFSSVANGTYEIDAVINGETATMYGGLCWVTVGR